MNQYSLGGGSIPIVLVPRYELSLCHTSIKSDTWLSGNWCLCVWVVWLRDQEVRVSIITSVTYYFKR